MTLRLKPSVPPDVVVEVQVLRASAVNIKSARDEWAKSEDRYFAIRMTGVTLRRLKNGKARIEGLMVPFPLDPNDPPKKKRRGR